MLPCLWRLKAGLGGTCPRQVVVTNLTAAVKDAASNAHAWLTHHITNGRHVSSLLRIENIGISLPGTLSRPDTAPRAPTIPGTAAGPKRPPLLFLSPPLVYLQSSTPANPLAAWRVLQPERAAASAFHAGGFAAYQSRPSVLAPTIPWALVPKSLFSTPSCWYGVVRQSTGTAVAGPTTTTHAGDTGAASGERGGAAGGSEGLGSYNGSDSSISIPDTVRDSRRPREAVGGRRDDGGGGIAREGDAGGPWVGGSADSASGSAVLHDRGGVGGRGGGGGTGGGGGGKELQRARKREGKSHPRRIMAAIQDAPGTQALLDVLRRHRTALRPNPLLQVAALSKLTRVATAGPSGPAPTFAGTGIEQTSVSARSEPASPAPAPAPAPALGEPGAFGEGASTGAAAPLRGSRPSAQQHRGSAAALDEGGCVREALRELLPLALDSVPRMRSGELASCAWALGKLRPVWSADTTATTTAATSGPAVSATAGQVADAICRRLAADWLLPRGPNQPAAAGHHPPPPAGGPNSAAEGHPAGGQGTAEAGAGAVGVEAATGTGPADKAPLSAAAAAVGASAGSERVVNAVEETGVGGAEASPPGAGGIEVAAEEGSDSAAGVKAMQRPSDAAGSSAARGGDATGSIRGATTTTTASSSSTGSGNAGGDAGSSGVTAPLWSQASTQDVANLAWGLARAGRGGRQHGGAWQWLAGAAGDVLWSGQAREVANLVWAFAATGRWEPQVYGNLLTALASPQRGPEVVRQLREEECTAVLWALATALGRLRGGARTGGDDLAPAAAGVAAFGGGRPSPGEEDGETPEGGGGGGGDGSELWVGGGKPAGLTRAMERLGERAAELALHGKLTGRQTSSLLWSLAVLQDATGCELESSWLMALSRRAAHTSRFMDGQALGNTAWALGKFRVDYAGAADALCAATLAALRAQSHSLTQGQHRGSLRGARLEPVWAAAAGGAADAAAPGGPSPHDLVQVLWGCGRLKHRHEQLLEAVQDRLLPCLPRMDPWDIVQLAASLASLDCYSTSTFSALCRRAAQLMPPLSPQQQQPQQPQPQQVLGAAQLVVLVSALGRVEHYDSGLVDEACDRLRTRLGELRPREVIQLVAALGRLEHPHPDLLTAVQDAVLYDIRPYKAPDLVALLYGIASTGTSAERLFARAAAVLQRQLRELDAEGVVQLAEAFAVNSLPDDDLFEEMAALAMRRGSSFSRRQIDRLVLAFKSLGYEGADQLAEAWQGSGP